MGGNDVVNLVKQQGRSNVLIEGEKVLTSDLITHIDYEIEEKCLVADAWVLSSDLFSEYEVSMVMDLRTKRIKLLSCSCQEYEKNSLKKEFYACKHIMATALKIGTELGDFKLDKTKESFSETIKPIEEKGEALLKDIEFEASQHESLNFEVVVKRNQQSYVGELKIGFDKLYIIKDINQFIHCYVNGEDLIFGKSFVYNSWKYKMPEKLKEVLSFINSLKESDDLSGRLYDFNKQSLVCGKNFTIVQGRLKEFLNILKYEQFSLELEGVKYKAIEVSEEELPISFNIDELKENIVVTHKGNLPKPLNTKGDVYLFNKKLYLLDFNKAKAYKNIFIRLDKNKKIYFKNNNLRKVMNLVFPLLEELTTNIDIDNKIKEKLVREPLKVKFYFDKEGEIFLDLKLLYGKTAVTLDEEKSKKIILRDISGENQVVDFLYSVGFKFEKGKFYFRDSDEKLYKFLTKHIHEVVKFGEVFYSESFKNLKINKELIPKGQIKSKGRDYFEFSYGIEGVAPEEMKKILDSFRKQKKFYRLKDGELLNLDEKNIINFLELLDNLSYDETLDGNILKISKSRAIYMDNIIEERNLSFIGGIDEVQKIKEKITTIETLEFNPPSDLKAELRPYQKIGFRWFKTLAYLGFGGILGDEMGLGKTLQAISFIASELGETSLIVAPTSLIYNWEREFSKFAPNVKVGVVNGNKAQRSEIINEASSYDVLVTSYNLLRIDSGLYNNMKFKHFLIDEAQNIKNPSANITQIIKNIKAETRFALTGTPIENSIVELWSIFDFALPGYLYSEKSFMNKFGNNIATSKESLNDLNKLIKPFMLRRLKSEVIKELPAKIEKKLIVEMTEQQNKAYGVYVKEAKEKVRQCIEEEGFVKSKFKILSYLTKLRQLCLDPAVVMEDYEGGSGKYEALKELLDQSIEEGHKILIFSQFTSVLGNLTKLLKEQNINYNYLDGSTKAEERMRLVNEFNEGHTPVFLISLKAGGTGLNLTGADVVIHFDPWWNPAVEEQATDRAHRFGQQNVVQVIKLIAKGTVEEKIVELQEEKKEVIKMVLGDDLQGNENFKSFSEKDIMEIFR